MSPGTYIPHRGDAVWADLDPTFGHEQGGRRPVLVLTRARYNQLTGMAVVCPITNRLKNYPFEIKLPDGLPVTGAVLIDQVRTIDWRARRLEFIASLPSQVLERVTRRLANLIINPV